MTDANRYENIQFQQNINTIPASGYPSSYSLHWHKYVEIVALPPDAKNVPPSVLRINQTEYTMHPGDILFIWPGELHETCSNPNKQLIGIQFSSGLISDLPDFKPYVDRFRSFHSINSVNAPEFSIQIMESMEQIFSLYRKGTPFGGVEAQIVLYHLFIDFASFLQILSGNNSLVPILESSDTMQKINKACSYISQNCSNDISLQDLSKYVGFSPFYLSRIFKQITGYRFVEYLTLQRIRHAQSLLSDSNLTMTEIAYRSGFKSISTFNRVFHQYRGCSPREYRRYYAN